LRRPAGRRRRRTHGGGSRIQRGWPPDSQLFGSVTTQARRSGVYDRPGIDALTKAEGPKGTDLSGRSEEHLAAVAAELNSRPRKTLRWKTPAEAFDEQLLSLEQAGVATTERWYGRVGL
jgi:hypothetical protein